MIEKRSVWWKIYFYIILCLNSLAFVFLFITELNDDISSIYYYKSDLIYDLFLMVLTIIGIIGYFGFIYKKIIFNREFWVLVFFMLLSIDFGNFLSVDTRNEFLIYVSFTDIIISIPLYMGLYYYTFKMKLLWEVNK